VIHQAVILAAGRGSRLGAEGQGRPKCLQRIGERTILDIQLGTLHSLGVQRICVVAGYCREQVFECLARVPGSAGIVNPVFDETNSLYSLWLARHWLNGPFLCMNADVIAHPGILQRLATLEGTGLAYDSGSGQEEEHMKVHTDGLYLRAISKQLPLDKSDGENVGFLKFDAEGGRAFLKTVDEMVRSGRARSWTPEALNLLARHQPVRCVDIAGHPWIEVDFPEDLEAARHRVWPLIRARIPAPSLQEDLHAPVLQAGAPSALETREAI